MPEDLDAGVASGGGAKCVSFTNGNLMIAMESSLNGYICKAVLIPKTQGALQTKGQKDCKEGPRIREFYIKLCVLVISEAIPVMCHKHNCTNMQT